VAIDPERIDLEIDLTAGANIASRILEFIDTDGDGRVSDVEGDAYARRVLDSIALSIDGRPVPVVLAAHEFPGREAIAAGTGTIRLRATAPASSQRGRHQLVYMNTHLPETSVYLVNALVPSDERVRLAAPRRDRTQRSFTLDYDIGPEVAWLRAGWLVVAVTAFGMLALVRRRRALPAAAALMLAVGITEASLLACATLRPGATNVPLDSRFTVKPAETAAIEGTSLRVRFDRVVEDSRCPADVSCIQAGDAIVRITVIQEGASAKSYDLHTAATGSRSAAHGDLTIALEELAPRPVSSRAIAPQNYRATLRASR